MDGTGSTFVDSSGTPKTVSAYGNATQSATESKFGGKSAYFDGSGDYLQVPSIPFGTSDFCIEMWFLSSSRTQYAQLIGNEATGGFSLLVNNNGAGQVALYATSGLVLSSSGDWTDGQWHHIAIVRTGNSFSLYLDGTRNATGSSSSSFSSSSDAFIARNNNVGPARDFAGYIDDIRVTLGTNRAYEGLSIAVPARAFLDYDGLTLPVTISGGGTDSRWDLFLPPAPTGLTVTGGNAQASLAWTAPTGVIAQAPITDYTVQFSSDSGSTWTTFSDGASATASAVVTGLANGTAYVFRVAAINGVGAGVYTAASSSVTPIAGTPPNAPTSLTATAGDAQLALSWTAPSAPGTSAISGYTVEYTPSGGSAQTVSTGSTSASYTLTGLTNGTAYTVRVAGVSAVGTGSYSSTATGTPARVSLTSSGWSGAGTAASKLAPPASPASFGGATISVVESGTLNVSFASQDTLNDGWEVQILRNGGLTYSFAADAANGTTATRPVTAGQTITLTTSGGGAQWLAGTRLWIS
jgi:hypothetical protein